MYGFQGNNSQSYNYQNPNGSFGSISQYAGPYHPYYSNATAAYNTFPSNEAPCSSLGIIPQEYNQASNGIPRPYFYDTNSSYSRPYQGLPFNQSVEIPIANSFSTCPRNCHCCEPLKPKYFNSINAVSQQASAKNPYDPTLNAAYNGLRKSFDTNAWRECNPQMPNLKDANDSAAWSIPKYGNGYKTETCPWPLPQGQITKFEGSESLGSANNYILSQQNQRIALPNSQTYSNIHPNSLRPAACPSPGKDLLGSSLVGYQHSSYSDFPQNNSESHSHPNSSVNSVQTLSRTTCNLPYGDSLTCRYSTSTSQVINENQKCVVGTPAVIAPSSGTLVDSFQRRFVTNNMREEVKDNSNYQSFVFPSANSINFQTRRVFNAPNESDATFRLNCDSNESINPVAASRLQLPPIQSLRPSNKLFRHSSRDYTQDHSHPSTKSGQQNLNEISGTRMRRSTSLANAPIRNLTMSTTDRYCNSTDPETFNKTHSEDGNNATILNNVYSNQYMEEQKKDSSSNSRLAEDSNKLKPVKNSLGKLSSSNISSGISDLRHFLSTWDDVDDEDSPNSAQDVVSDGSKGYVEINSEEISVVTEYPSNIHKLSEGLSCSRIADEAIPAPDVGPEEFPRKGVTYPVDHVPQYLGHSFESVSFSKSANINETEITDYESNSTLKNDTNKHKEKKKRTSRHQAKRSFSYSELSTCSDLSNCGSSSRPSKSVEAVSHGCMSFLDMNTSESEVSYRENMPSEERIFETLKRKKDYKEILHSSDGKSLKILSLDLAVQGSSVTQNKNDAYKIQSCMEGPREEPPVIQKTFFSGQSKSEGNNLDLQNGITNETDNNDAIITQKKDSAGTSNKAKSKSISLESDTMVFYNLTARVDVTLERLEVPSMSINERNDCSSNMLTSNSQAKRTLALEPNNMKRSKSKSSEMNQILSKDKEKSSYLSYVNDEVHPNVIKETDHDYEVSGSSFANDGDKSISQTEDSDIDCIAKKSKILPANVNESSIDNQKVKVEHDNGVHERCLFGGNGNRESEDEILSPEVQNVPEIRGKEIDENERTALESVETENFREEDIIYEVKGISEVHNRYANGHERTLPCAYKVCEFGKTEVITEAISVPEMSKKKVEIISLDKNEVDVRLVEKFDHNEDITKAPGKEANEHERSLLESNEIRHLEEVVSVVEVMSISDMPIEKDVTKRSLLANNVTKNVRGAEKVTNVKDITEMSVEEADVLRKGLKSNDIFSVKEIESVAKVKSLSEGPIELNEFGESLIDNVCNVVHNFKGLRASPEYLNVPERLRKETDELSFKISHSCKERNAKYSVPESKDGQKHIRRANKAISRCFRKTTCNAIMSIRKKYHYFHLSKDRKKSHTEMIHMIRSMKKNANIKRNSNFIPKAVAKRNIKNKRNLGTNLLLKNYAGDNIISDSKDVDIVCYEGKSVITDNEMFNECTVVTESVNTLPATSCFSKRIIEHDGLTSSQYLCCSDNNVENDGESAEENGGNVILNVEEKAIVLEGLGESCVIGNVEVFMGLEGGEASTIEEKGSSFALGPPIEEILKEDTVGVQYWDSYEFDNSLGVAMEVEVGSEIEGDTEMVLLDHAQVEDIADSVSNDKSIFLAEDNLDSLLLQASSSLNRFSNKKMDWNGIVGKKDICRFPSRGEEVVCLPDNGRCVSFHEKGDNDFSDSAEVINDTDLNPENGQIFDDVEPTKIPSPIYIFTSVSKNYSKPCQDTSFPVIQNNDSDKNKTLEMKCIESVEVESFKTENDYTSPDIKENSFKTGRYLHSLSNLRQFQKNTKRKTVIEEEKGTDLRSYKLCSLNLSSRNKSWVKNEYSAHFFASKMKMIPEKKKRSVARKDIESHDGYILPIEEDIIDEFYVKKDKSCEESGSVLDSAKVDEEEQVKDNACNTSSKCRVYEVAIGASKKKSESKDGKDSRFYKKNLKECDVSSKKVNYRINVSAKVSENNQSENLIQKCDDFLIAQDKIDRFPKKHVSEQKRENEGQGSSGCLQKLKIKVKEKKNFQFSAGRVLKNNIISQSHLHKFARYGFWKARKWPYSCILNKRKPLKKPSKIFDAPEFCDLEKNTLPLILKSYPNPPFLSPLQAYSDTHNLTFSSFKSSSEKHRNEELSKSIHSQCSEQPIQSKSGSAHSSLCTTEDSKRSISTLPVIDSNKITNFQYNTTFPVTKYKSEEQIMSASTTSKTELTKDTKNIKYGDMHSASPYKLQENNFSISSNKILGSEYSSNDNPRVCITFKKVGIADRNEKWMKTSIQDEFSKNQEARKEQFIRNRIDYSFESPLPKVTIKKKNGEGGYQSFLSGFSSYLPVRSSPVTSATHFLIPPNSEDCDAAEQNALVQENHHAQGMKSKGMIVSKSNANARNIQEVCPRRNLPAFDEVQSGMLEKKTGSGLVFVIRGFGNHVKEDHPKKSVSEQNQVSCKQMETSDQDGILSQISENCLSSEDEELQSIPWSIWQPVVKLSRSCELDALARELCNTDEDSQIGDNSQKQHQNSKISCSKFVQSSSQEANIKSECRSLKPMKDSGNRIDSDEDRSGLKKKELEKKVEKKQSAFIRNLSFESSKKHAIDSQKPHNKLVHEKSFDATLQQIEEVEEKKMQLEKAKSSANFKVLNESLKHIMCPNRSINKEKNLLQPNLPVPTLPLKIKSETNLLEKRKDLSTSFRKEKAKRLSTKEDKAEIKEFLDCVKDEMKSSASGMQMSKESNSFDMPEWKDDPRSRVDVNMHKEEQIGKSKISPFIQDFKSNKSSREKLTYISLCSEKDPSSNVQRKKRYIHLFQCEACCRRFSSEKWLRRHCKGVSHTRVENAQRVAVQALLLLLTGDESKSLRPLSEIELANLNNWSSHSAPSPLQVALKELLHPAKDQFL